MKLMEKSHQKALRHDYEVLVHIVKQALNEWDPFDLIHGGAPDNEFTAEATQIAARIKKHETPTALAKVISDIFSKNFESNLFPVETCLPIASRIFKDLEARSLLS
jgi:hypothetical protein